MNCGMFIMENVLRLPKTLIIYCRSFVTMLSMHFPLLLYKCCASLVEEKTSLASCDETTICHEKTSNFIFS